MRKQSAILLVVVLSGLPTVQAAEPAKRGVSPRSAARLKQLTLANAAKDSSRRARLLQQAAEATAGQLKSERQAFNTALEEQPEYKQVKMDMDSIAALVKDPGTAKDPRKQKELNDRLQAFSAKYDGVQQRAYQQARIDDNRVRAVIGANFARLVNNSKIERRGLGWIVRSGEDRQSEPEPSPPACFTPPYDTDFAHAETTFLGATETTAEESTGQFNVDAQGAFAAGASAEAGVGNNFTIPSGSHDVDVTASFDIEYAVEAAAAWGVASWAGVDLQIAATDLSGSSKTHSGEVIYQLSPIVWIASEQGSEEMEVTNTFTLSGGEHLIDARAIAYLGAAAPGTATATVSGTVEEICVEVLD